MPNNPQLVTISAQQKNDAQNNVNNEIAGIAIFYIITYLIIIVTF